MKRIVFILALSFICRCGLTQGYYWQTYNTSNSGIAGNLVTSLAFDSYHGLWVANECGGLNYFLNGRWIHYGSVAECITSIKIDGAGNKWLGTFEGLKKFDGTNWTTYSTSNSAIPGLTVLNVEIDLEGNIWVGTYNGVGKFNGSTWQVYNTGNSTLRNNQVNKILCDSQGRIWVGTQDGLSSFINGTWTGYDPSNSTLFYSGIIFDIAEDGYGRIWIAESTDLHKFENESWHKYWAGHTIRTLGVDTENHLWLGTYNEGIFEYEGGTWYDYFHTTVYTTSNSGLCNNAVFSFAAVDNGDHWAGTFNGLSHFTYSLTGSTDANPDLVLIDPNPFTTQTVLSFTREQKNLLICISDLAGHIVTQMEFSGRQMTIGRGNLKSGMYILSVTNRQKQLIASKKLIVQ